MNGVTLVEGAMGLAMGSAMGSCLTGRAVERVRGESLRGKDGSTFIGKSSGVGSSLILIEGGFVSMVGSVMACSEVSTFTS